MLTLQCSAFISTTFRTWVNATLNLGIAIPGTVIILRLCMYANCHVTLPPSRLDLRSSLSWWTVGLQVMIGSGKLGKQEIFADANLPDSTINQVMDGPANLNSGALEVHPLGYWALCTGIVLLRRLIAGWGSLIWSPSVNFICLHRISLANLSRCF